jgi:hypothetical protein
VACRGPNYLTKTKSRQRQRNDFVLYAHDVLMSASIQFAHFRILTVIESWFYQLQNILPQRLKYVWNADERGGVRDNERER